MAYTYKGIELVNCSPPKRKGPFTKFPFGKYSGRSIEDIIRSNPSYILWAVKEWLDLTPSQAGLFERITGGGIIPDRYIKEIPPKVVSPIQVSPPKQDTTYRPKEKTDGSVPEWTGADCTWPNLGFDPELAPEWWPEFEERIKRLTGPQAKWLFEDYRKKELKELQKMWNEYRDPYSKE